MSADGKQSGHIAVLGAAVLLLLTAWGDAIVMCAVSATVLVALLAFYRGPVVKQVTVASISGGIFFLVAVAIQRL